VSGGYVRADRVRRILKLRGELTEIGLGSEAARKHLMSTVLTDVGAIVGALAYDVRGGDQHGIKASTLAGFDRTTLPIFAAHRVHGRKYNPVCREQMRLLAGDQHKPGDMVTASNAQLVATSEWKECAFVNEYVQPARAAHYLGSVMWFAPGVTEGIGMMRAAGDRPFSAEDCLVLHLVREGIGRLFGDPVELPPRVREVFAILITGASDKEIAAHLGIAVDTARKYVKRILRAYGVSSRAHLIAQVRTGKASAVAAR
jgi:DNA-binding CsgD family transcriptional regulator